MNAARTCVGAFCSPSSTCCHGQSSETIRSSAVSKSRATAGSACSLIVNAGRRVRHVDKRRRRAVQFPERRLHLSGDVDELAPPLRLHHQLAHGAYPRLRERETPTERELDGYRAGADRFDAELNEEYYLHYAGLKPDLDLRSIYERHADLIDLETVKGLGRAVRGRENLELFRFGCERYLGQLTREDAEKIAELETTLETQHDGEQLGYRMLHADDLQHRRPTDRGEARRGAERADRRASEPDLPGSRRPDPARRSGARRTHVLQLYRDRFQLRPGRPRAQCSAFLDSTERLYEESMDRVLRERVGIGLAEAERYDVRRFFRGSSWDKAFPADRMVPALRGTLSNLGIDLDAQENVHLDVEERPTKSPRGVLRADRDPGQGDAGDPTPGWPGRLVRALPRGRSHGALCVHEPQPEMEEKRLGDNAVTEGWAMLFDHLIDDRAWLSRMLDFPRPETFAAEGAVQLLFYVRRYCAKLLYEIEFHAAPDPTQMQSRYVEILGDALKVLPSPTDYLADIDASYYVTSYLRAWAFSAQMTTFMREEFGSDWFRRREAGSLLKELWELGQQPNADELLKDVTGAAVEMEAVAEHVRSAIPTPA